MSGGRDKYSSDELANIKAMLQESLGDASGDALKNLEERFTPAEEVADESAKEEAEEKEAQDAGGGGRAQRAVDIDGIIAKGSIEKILGTLPTVKDNEQDVRRLVAAILKNPKAKSFHLVDALSKVKKDLELVKALVHGIITRKGVNPLIDAMKHATASPEAIVSLAQAIADQGTVNHVLRAIASSPKDQPQAEVIWAMEVMGKGTIEQMLEAMKLIETLSPGVVVLATGLVNRADAGVEPLVRALGGCRDNDKATALITMRLMQLVDVPSLVSLLEKHVKQESEAAEIAASRLVQRCAGQESRRKVLISACRKMRGDSKAGHILALGIVNENDLTLMERVFKTMPCVSCRKIIALAYVKKKGKIMSLKNLGKAVLTAVKDPAAIRKDMSEAKARYDSLVSEHLESMPEPKARR